MELNSFLSGGIQNIGKTAARFYIRSRRGRKFMKSMVRSFREDAEIRERMQRESATHVPPFLIASVADECNLRCTGCYARANGGCGGGRYEARLSADDWSRIFVEASGLGVSFVLIAGGEPLLRRDVIKAAADRRDIMFPVFTNGTVIDEEYIKLFNENRNVVPVLSIEGDAEITDKRRGAGVHAKLTEAMHRFKQKGILFGASITVTHENQHEVTDPDFIKQLKKQGCGLVFFVEYVPAEPGTEHLMLDDAEMKALGSAIDKLRKMRYNKSMILLSFPGDEEMLGGCLAAGRGFFHINSSGGAEPCPFSPFTATNVKEHSLLSAIKSPFFEKVREIGAEDHKNRRGGCSLFNHETDVRRLLMS